MLSLLYAANILSGGIDERGDAAQGARLLEAISLQLAPMDEHAFTNTADAAQMHSPFPSLKPYACSAAQTKA